MVKKKTKKKSPIKKKLVAPTPKITKNKKHLPELKSKNLPKNPNEEFNIAHDFAIKTYTKFQEAIKSIVLFGSAAKLETTKGSDIDILIIIDDCSIQWDEELIAWYREELRKLLEKQTYAERIHINSVTLSTFWEDVKEGEPAAINILRYG